MRVFSLTLDESDARELLGVVRRSLAACGCRPGAACPTCAALDATGDELARMLGDRRPAGPTAPLGGLGKTTWDGGRGARPALRLVRPVTVEA